MHIFQNYVDKALIKRLPALHKLLQEDQERRSPKVTVHQRPGYKEGKLERSFPIKFLPNTEKFEIRPTVRDWLLRLFKLSKKWDPEIEMYQWMNGPANKYLNYMFRRLRKQVEMKLYKEAQVTMWIMMKSSAYQAAAFNKVFHNWHRTWQMNDVYKVLKDLNNLIKLKQTTISFRRVYIPKDATNPEGPQRPLGVPDPAWRVYLHMYNNLLVTWRLVSEGNSQHGYLPGRGVMTAWMQLFPLLKSEPNIYEADFKSFFDTIPHYAISMSLMEMGLPDKEVIFINKLNSSIVKIKRDKDPVFEPTRRVMFNSDGSANKYRKSGSVIKVWHPMEKYGVEVDSIAAFKALDNSSEQFKQRPEKSNRNIAIKKDWGVPQGAPTSCSLSTLVLREIERQVKCVIYADDLIIFPKEGEDPEQILSSIPGVAINKEKSRWVKRNGSWVVNSLKFLGFTYKPARWTEIKFKGLTEFLGITRYKVPERFLASTRKGATLEFKSWTSFMVYLYNARDLALNVEYFWNKAVSSTLVEWIKYQENGWKTLRNQISTLFKKEIVVKRPNMTFKHLIRKPILGYIMSRMTMNKWNIRIHQDFTLKYRKASWMWTNWPWYSWQNILSRKEITIFTASTFASHDLLRIVSQIKGKSPLIIYTPSNPVDRTLKRLIGDRRRARKLKKWQPWAAV